MTLTAATRAVFGAVYLLWAAMLGAAAWLYGGFGCYESCYDHGSHWSDHHDAWQWDAIVDLGVTAALAAVAVVVVVGLGRSRGAWFVYAVQVAFTVATFVLVAQAEDGMLLVGLVVLLGESAGAACIHYAERPVTQD